MEAIDYVVTYVDSSDPNWKDLYRKRMHGLDPISNSRRYRDMNTIMYAIRSIEKFIPWINHIYFVVQSESQIPNWLNRDNPKIKIVYHEDYIPREFLPTFNSNVIEMFMHKLPGLSKNFILANDDMIIVKPLSPEHFFMDEKPVDPGIIANRNYALENNKTFKHIKYNCAKLASELANSKELILYSNYHLPMAHSLDIWNEVWAKASKEIIQGLKNSPKRTIRNYNHWLFRYYGLLTGKYFVSPEINKSGYMGLNDNTILFEITERISKSEMICLNDAVKDNSDEIYRIVNLSLSKILPDKSSFEV